MLTRRSLIASIPAAAAASLSPAAIAAAPRGLPPLPAPGQPDEQVLAALVRWHGGTRAAISALAETLQSHMALDDDLCSIETWWASVDPALEDLSSHYHQLPATAEEKTLSGRRAEAIAR